MFSFTQSLNQDLTDNTCDGKCTQCGECCNDMIALTETDITRIKRYMQRNHIKTPEDHTIAYNLMGANPTRTIDLTCPFLVIRKPGSQNGQQRTSCKIYSVRPAVCRAFTCQIASDKKKIMQVYETAQKLLTQTELKQLASSVPVSMRKTFFSK